MKNSAITTKMLPPSTVSREFRKEAQRPSQRGQPAASAGIAPPHRGQIRSVAGSAIYSYDVRHSQQVSNEPQGVVAENHFAGIGKTTATAFAQKPLPNQLTLINEPVMNRIQRQLEPVRHSQFIKNVVQVIFHGLFADK